MSLVSLPAAHRRLAIAGWALYAISWVTPAIDGRRTGAEEFLATVKLALSLLFESGTARGTVVGLCLLLGWLANFSILFRPPVWCRIVWMVAPWLPFTIAMLFMRVPPSLPERLASRLYFYPWAVGIALVHIASIAEVRSRRGSHSRDL